MSFNPSYSMTVKEKLSEKTAKGIGLHGINKGKLTDKCCSLAFFYGVTLLSKKLDKETMTLSLENEKLLEICTYIMIQHFLAVPTVRERERAGKRKFEVSFKKELVGQDLRDTNIIKRLKEVDALNYFDAFTGGSDVKNGKPAPDIFLRAASLIDAKPEECFVFEDSVNGILAGTKAGMKCIGVPDIVRFPDEIKKILFAELDDLSQGIPLLKKYI